jgi:hypothetical protein
MLSTTKWNPYRACAWIKHSFLWIYPFAYGKRRHWTFAFIDTFPETTLSPPVNPPSRSRPIFRHWRRRAIRGILMTELADFLQRETFRAGLWKGCFAYKPVLTSVVFNGSITMGSKGNKKKRNEWGTSSLSWWASEHQSAREKLSSGLSRKAAVWFSQHPKLQLD